MFGKVIQLKKNASGSGRGGELPAEITKQFNSEVLEKGLRLAESSRISHINFGRESYFGLVSDSSGKGVNVHISLDPETRFSQEPLADVSVHPPAHIATTLFLSSDIF